MKQSRLTKEQVEDLLHYIGVDNKHIHLGVFDTPEEAYEHRLKAEKEYYEDFSSKGGDVNYE